MRTAVAGPYPAGSGFGDLLHDLLGLGKIPGLFLGPDQIGSEGDLVYPTGAWDEGDGADLLPVVVE
jgi:hypothetical protein